MWPKNKCLLRSGARNQATPSLSPANWAARITCGETSRIQKPRLSEEPAGWRIEFSIHAMIDLSDAASPASLPPPSSPQSKTGAEIFSKTIPISRAAKLRARAESSAKPPLLAALSDGEDFELLFTVSSRDAVPLLDAWKKQFPKLKLSCIGKITSTPGLKLRDENGVRILQTHGYVHFA